MAKRLAHHRESRKRTNASAPKTPQIAIAFLKFDKALSMRTSTFPLGKKSAVETALLAPLARARLLITLFFCLPLPNFRQVCAKTQSHFIAPAFRRIPFASD